MILNRTKNKPFKQGAQIDDCSEINSQTALREI
jgi:hypothetical protein